jgi:hypothetical protein
MNLKVSRTGLRAAIFFAIGFTVIGLMLGAQGQAYASFALTTVVIIAGSSILKMAVCGAISKFRLFFDTTAALTLIISGFFIIRDGTMTPFLVGGILGAASIIVGTIKDVKEGLLRGSRIDLASISEPYRFIVVFIMFFPMIIEGFMLRVHSDLRKFDDDENDHFSIFKKSSDIIAGLGRLLLLGGLLVYLAGTVLMSMAEYGAFMGIASFSMIIIVSVIMFGHFRVIVEFFVVSAKSNIEILNQYYLNHDSNYIEKIHASIIRNGLLFLGGSGMIFAIMGRIGLF